MESIIVDIIDEPKKKILVAFLDSMNYKYQIHEDDYGLTGEQIVEMMERKADFLAGKTKSRPWTEIRHKYDAL